MWILLLLLLLPSVGFAQVSWQGVSLAGFTVPAMGGSEDFTKRSSCKGAWLLGNDCTDSGDTTCEDYCTSDGADNGTNYVATVSSDVPTGSPSSARSLNYAGNASGHPRTELSTDTKFRSQNFSAMCWYKQTSSTDRSIVLGRNNPTQDYGWTLWNDWGSDYCSDYPLSSIPTTAGHEFPCRAATVASFTGVWAHLAVTWNGSGSTYKLYKNAQNDCSGGTCSTQTGTLEDPTGNLLMIGASQDDYAYHLDGKVYECAYFNEELTQQNICDTCECGLRGDATAPRDCGCTSACQTTTTTSTTTTTTSTTTTTLGYGIDRFDRSDEALCGVGKNWSAQPTGCTSCASDWDVTSSATDYDETSTDEVCFYNAWTPSSNTSMYACRKVTTIGSSGDVSIGVCDSAACIFCNFPYAQPNVCTLWDSNGWGNGCAGSSFTLNNGDYIGIERTAEDTFNCKTSSNGSSWTARLQSGNPCTNLTSMGTGTAYGSIHGYNGPSYVTDDFEVGNGTLPTTHVCGSGG